MREKLKAAMVSAPAPAPSKTQSESGRRKTVEHKTDGDLGRVPQVPGDSSGAGGHLAYCPICGRDGDPGLKRFGQFFCSGAHVAQYASERRAHAELGEARPAAVATRSQGASEVKGVSCNTGMQRGLGKLVWCCAGGLGLLVGDTARPLPPGTRE